MREEPDSLSTKWSKEKQAVSTLYIWQLGIGRREVMGLRLPRVYNWSQITPGNYFPPVDI